MGGPLGASIRLLRPTCGLPAADSPPVVERAGRYTAISNTLRQDGVPEKYCSAERLSQLVLELRTCMDKLFGRLSDPAKQTMTMLPAFIFRDFAPHGALFTLLKGLIDFAEARGLEVQFEKEELGAELLKEGEKLLKKAGWLKLKKIFISPLVDEDEQNLRDILQRHGAIMVSNSLVATHILYPDPDGTREHQTDGQALVRVLERATFRNEQFALLHWFHHPDSYDDWVPADEVLGHVYMPRGKREREQWHLQARWARDLEQHNEWMNELDYEMANNFDQYVGRSPQPPKLDQKGRPYNSLVRLRLRLPTVKEIDKAAGRNVDVGNGGVPSPKTDLLSENTIKGPNDSVGEQMDVDIKDSLTDKLANNNSDDSDGDQFMLSTACDVQREQQAFMSSEQQPTKIAVGDGVYIPFFAKWFSLQSVHDIEKRALPEFFHGRFPSKNERTYREIRNYMVQMWRENPHEHVSRTTARRRLAGDACCILRIHGFLEHWGLINYGGSAEGTGPLSFAPPPRPLPLYAGHGREDPTRIRPSLILDSGSKVQIKDEKVTKFGRNNEVLSNGRMESVLIRETDRNGDVSSIAEPPQREPIEYHCDSCGVDCSTLRFHCATKADMDLCASCYQNAKYSATMKPRDFIQMNSASLQGGNEESDPDAWTESETLLLLEALEMYGDNWTLVSEHVGSKGKTQCVVQFLRLPIEDTFLTQMTKNWWLADSADPEEASPAEMMRRAGARESALKAVNNKSTNSRQLTGQPLVFGDQISTTSAFASALCSQVPPKLMGELTNVLGVGNRKKRTRSFWVAGKGEAGRRREDATDEELLTETLYKQTQKKVCTPVDLLRTRWGENLARGASSLIENGTIADDEVTEMAVEPSPQVPEQDYKLTGILDAGKEARRKGQDNNEETNGEDDCEGLSKLKVDDADVEKSAAVSMTCLAAACASAAHRQALEEAELERLKMYVNEIGQVLVEKRKEQRERIDQYERFAIEYLKRRKCEKMGERVDQALARIKMGRTVGEKVTVEGEVTAKMQISADDESRGETLS